MQVPHGDSVEVSLRCFATNFDQCDIHSVEISISLECQINCDSVFVDAVSARAYAHQCAHNDSHIPRTGTWHHGRNRIQCNRIDNDWSEWTEDHFISHHFSPLGCSDRVFLFTWSPVKSRGCSPFWGWDAKPQTITPRTVCKAEKQRNYHAQSHQSFTNTASTNQTIIDELYSKTSTEAIIRSHHQTNIHNFIPKDPQKMMYLDTNFIQNHVAIVRVTRLPSCSRHLLRGLHLRRVLRVQPRLGPNPRPIPHLSVPFSAQPWQHHHHINLVFHHRPLRRIHHSIIPIHFIGHHQFLLPVLFRLHNILLNLAIMLHHQSHRQSYRVFHQPWAIYQPCHCLHLSIWALPPFRAISKTNIITSGNFTITSTDTILSSTTSTRNTDSTGVTISSNTPGHFTTQPTSRSSSSISVASTSKAISDTTTTTQQAQSTSKPSFQIPSQSHTSGQISHTTSTTSISTTNRY